MLSLEGADSIVTLAHLERAYAQGLRAVGPAHYGPGVYANGTNATGDLGTRGRELLREMERLGIILDATHLCDDSFRDALDHFHGPVWASHSNCRALVQHNRQFTDDQISELIAARRRHRRGVRRLDARARLGPRESTPERDGVTLETVADHIDHICQMAGQRAGTAGSARISTAHSAASSARRTCDTIADLANLPGDPDAARLR